MDDFEWVTSNEGVWSTDCILQNHTTDEVSFSPSVALGVPQTFGPEMRAISALHLCPKTLALHCKSLSRNQPRAGCLWSTLVYIWIHVIFRFSTKSPSAQLAWASVSYILDIFHTWTRRKLLRKICPEDFVTMILIWICVTKMTAYPTTVSVLCVF